TGGRETPERSARAIYLERVAAFGPRHRYPDPRPPDAPGPGWRSGSWYRVPSCPDPPGPYNLAPGSPAPGVAPIGRDARSDDRSAPAGIPVPIAVPDPGADPVCRAAIERRCPAWGASRPAVPVAGPDLAMPGHGSGRHSVGTVGPGRRIRFQSRWCDPG